MKAVRKLSDDREAVSPVIAVILMVAITVVLAAVLYVMVGGLISGPGTTTPTGQLTASSVNATASKVTFTSLSPETKWDDCRLRLTDNSGNSHTWSLTYSAGSVNVATQGGSADFGGAHVVMMTIDEVAGTNKISQGDSATIFYLEAGRTYTATLIHIESGGIVDDVNFDK
jgi:flagellin-like protein